MSEEKDVVFREVQSFRGKFRSLHFLLALAIAGGCFAIAVAIKNSDKTPGMILASAGGMILVVGLAVLFTMLKLETEVRSDGLYVRYFPFHISYRKINMEDVSEYFACQYKPLCDYGGWGIKCGRGGKAYNVSGDRGVQLVFRSGKRLLIGSQRADELEKAIHSIM